jgi:hypothetical protein
LYDHFALRDRSVGRSPNNRQSLGKRPVMIAGHLGYDVNKLASANLSIVDFYLTSFHLIALPLRMFTGVSQPFASLGGRS